MFDQENHFPYRRDRAMSVEDGSAKAQPEKETLHEHSQASGGKSIGRPKWRGQPSSPWPGCCRGNRDIGREKDPYLQAGSSALVQNQQGATPAIAASADRIEE
jgi:hypothetical protein